MCRTYEKYLHVGLFCFKQILVLVSHVLFAFDRKFDATQFQLPQSSNAERPIDSLSYRNTIRSLSCHPFQDEVFLSASESGRIILHDERTWRNPSTRARDIIQVETEVCDVKFHPTMENIFASCDSKGNVCLRDIRLGFGPANKRRNHGVVQVVMHQTWGK